MYDNNREFEPKCTSDSENQDHTVAPGVVVTTMALSNINDGVRLPVTTPRISTITGHQAKVMGHPQPVLAQAMTVVRRPLIKTGTRITGHHSPGRFRSNKGCYYCGRIGCHSDNHEQPRCYVCDQPGYRPTNHRSDDRTSGPRDSQPAQRGSWQGDRTPSQVASRPSSRYASA